MVLEGYQISSNVGTWGRAVPEAVSAGHALVEALRLQPPLAKRRSARRGSARLVPPEVEPSPSVPHAVSPSRVPSSEVLVGFLLVEFLLVLTLLVVILKMVFWTWHQFFDYFVPFSCLVWNIAFKATPFCSPAVPGHALDPLYHVCLSFRLDEEGGWRIEET